VVIAGGRVLALARWPVKSMGGEEAPALTLDERGIAGDRTHALYDLHKDRPRRLTARQSPRLLAWGARYAEADPAPDRPPPALLRAPDGRELAWEDPELPELLAADLGRPVTLRRDPAGQQDLERSVLVTTRATHEAVERELGRPLDPRRWRTNVHVELDVPAYAEEGWEGRELRIGAASFRLLHPCVRCVIPTRDPDTQVKAPDLLRLLTRDHGGLFGMNARPLGRARIAVGDRVEVR
jgi:hypothetical protein